jgi:DNA-binding transcriptional regulator PaaX
MKDNKSSKKPFKTLVQNILLASLDNAVELHKMLSHPSAWLKGYETYNRHVIYNTFLRLKKEGYLAEVEERGEKKYRATLKGKTKILRFLKREKSWDGRWRIVIFDIPETQKKMRHFFRIGLIDLGFRQLQKSVWICPYNIADRVEELIDYHQAKDYVHYLLVEELDNRDVLMKLFKLSGEK